MRHIILNAILATTVAASLPLTASANEESSKWTRSGSSDKSNGDNHFVLKVGLWGDEFYNNDPEEKSIEIEQTINSMNAHRLDFTLFAGDTKNGSSECTDAAIGSDVETIFNSLNAPTLYAVGDNEWTDCHRTNNGSMDPLERLDYLRTTFFSKATTQGPDAIPVLRQGALGEAYSENSRFVMNNVEFVALHVPGSNNNLVATDKQCFNKSERTLTDCAAATAEYQARNVQNLAWLNEAFQEATDNNYAGIVILIQADVYFPFELSDGGYQDDFLAQLDPAYNGYADFFHTLIERTQSFDGEVLLVHGDSHYFKMDKAMFEEDGHVTPNFTRVEVFGSEENSWVEMTVDPTSEGVFSFKPIVLK